VVVGGITIVVAVGAGVDAPQPAKVKAASGASSNE